MSSKAVCFEVEDFAEPMDVESTIAGIATAPGPGGISVVRVSGERAIEVARKICVDLPANPSMRTAYRSRFVSPEDGALLDEGLVLLFKGPASFTGEDVAELHGHGGDLQGKALLRATLLAGSEPAGPGAFSRRAVENGRMDLARAEGIALLVAAESEAGLRAARALMQGALSRKVEELAHQTEGVLAEIEASIDFADDVPSGDEDSQAKRVWAIYAENEKLLRSWRDAERCRRGPRVVLFGPTNSGKSSLLNALSGFERAIVDSSPGTTRDLVEVAVEMEGHTLTLVDGAGVRETDFSAEVAGMVMLERCAKDADLVLGVFDASRPLVAEEERAAAALASIGRPLLLVANKSDLGLAGLKTLRSRFGKVPHVASSALTGDGIETLRRLVVEELRVFMPGEGEIVVGLARHHALLRSSHSALAETASLIEANASPELACEGLRSALESFCQILGRGDLHERILDRIFERFCIGK